MNTFFYRLLIFGLVALIMSCAPEPAPPYLGLTPPGDSPEKFAPGVVSLPDRYEFGSTFNRAGDEFYFAYNVANRTEIHQMKVQDGEWLAPRLLVGDDYFNYNDPMLSNDEKRLYFISRRPIQIDTENPANVENPNNDIWYVQRQENGWSQPVNAGPNINTDREEFYMSFTQDGDLCYSSNQQAPEDTIFNFDILISKLENGVFQKPEKMDPNIQSIAYDGDPYIDPKQRFVIFTSDRRGGFGKTDLYISYQDQDGSWTKAKNLGDLYNTDDQELCPYITPDQKYFFYTSAQDIYWVSAKFITDGILL
ncbi:MAG: hypothetical protein AAFQ02_05715 [Bacteroidota bacterium]